jgi:hypothetical protein
MALNPNIALAVKGPEFADPLAMYGKVAAIQGAQSQNQLAQLQMQQAVREQESTNALNQAYAAAYNPQTGDIDTNKLRQTIASLGQGSKLPGIEKSLIELQTARLGQQKTQGEILDAVTQRYRDTLGSIDPNSPTAGAQLMRAHRANHADPTMAQYLKGIGVDAAEGDAAIQDAISKGPTAIADFIQRSSMKSKDFHDFNKPNWVDIGGSKVPLSQGTGQPLKNLAPLNMTLTPEQKLRSEEVDYKDTGKEYVPVYKINGQSVPGLQPIPKGLSPHDALQLDKIEWKSDGSQLLPFNYKGDRLNIPAIPLRVSPDAAQTNKLAREKFDYEKANPGVTIKEAEDGSMLAINNKTGIATPVKMVNGALVAGKGKALTESQGNATTFGMRMVEADNLLSKLETEGVRDTGRIRAGASGTAGSIPLVGAALAKGVDNVFNVLPEFMAGLSPEQQQTLQARLNFVTAVLRKESGASISPSEFETAEKVYFPRAGDSDAVLAEKQKARKTAIAGMKVQAGPGASEINKRSGAGSPQVDTSNPLLR